MTFGAKVSIIMIKLIMYKNVLHYTDRPLINYGNYSIISQMFFEHHPTVYPLKSLYIIGNTDTWIGK